MSNVGGEKNLISRVGSGLRRCAHFSSRQDAGRRGCA